MNTATRCDRTRAWVALQGHFEAHGRDFDLRQAFARDPGRFDALSFNAPEVFADLSKNHIDLAGLRFLQDLARECDLPARRDALLRGAIANPSEGRAVLHTALRAPRGVGPFSDEVHGVLDAMLAYAEVVRADTQITDIVNSALHFPIVRRKTPRNAPRNRASSMQLTVVAVRRTFGKSPSFLSFGACHLNASNPLMMAHMRSMKPTAAQRPVARSKSQRAFGWMPSSARVRTRKLFASGQRNARAAMRAARLKNR